jgi:hypothetical protein
MRIFFADGFDIVNSRIERNTFNDTLTDANIFGSSALTGCTGKIHNCSFVNNKYLQIDSTCSILGLSIPIDFSKSSKITSSNVTLSDNINKPHSPFFLSTELEIDSWIVTNNSGTITEARILTLRSSVFR